MLLFCFIRNDESCVRPKNIRMIRYVTNVDKAFNMPAINQIRSHSFERLDEHPRIADYSTK